MDKSDVVIVVPIYKEKFNTTEQISMKRLYEVLQRYEIVFAAPERMKGFCTDRGYKTVFFADRFFQNTSTYSELLVSDFFYAEFADYEYMLIYQPDAYVFKDELLKFCNMGYDYIGAPVPRYLGEWGTVKARIGNGGLSLRKISSVRRVLADMPQICEKSGFKDLFYKHEDLFYGYCGACEEVDFAVPEIKTALTFAVDEDVCHIFCRLNEGSAELPFGCHGWNREHVYHVWCRFIPAAIPDYSIVKERQFYRDIQWCRLSEYILSRCRKYKCDKLVAACHRYFSQEQSYVIWGYGEYGRILYRLLKECGYEIAAVFDAQAGAKLIESEAVKPDMKYLKQNDCAIIITPVYYEKKIKENLLAEGIDASRIFTYSGILSFISADYMKMLAQNMM